MADVMIDIETLGNKPGVVLLSISAVSFEIETGETSQIFHQDIDVQSCVDKGLTIDGETVLWWLTQDKQAQEKITDVSHRNKLTNVLRQFGMWLHDWNSKDAKIWGNSARFDLGILAAAYNACNMRLPWEFYNEADVRTLVLFAPQIKKETAFEGIPHNGIDDCKHQIKYCSKIYQQLKFGLKAKKK